MNRLEKLWDCGYYAENEYKQVVNVASWIILGSLTLVSFFCFIGICTGKF